ncbi:unnamed protein product [Caenorhabditis auriculariae]|uniref:Uncharacterized protein n=1 Tax=Caenorhabditis auriculariae TaxID=2777116 RepID=A0A8S1GU25_9PELO|nr:unnamed protein product [Caenorhabditis auriculariae]
MNKRQTRDKRPSPAPETETKKRKLNSEQPEEDPKKNENDSGRPISPASLAHMLDKMRKELLDDANLSKAAALELSNFDISVETCDEFNKKRERIRDLLGNTTKYDDKTQLNYDEAAIAGAKLLVDQKITTRRISKQLHDCGIDENSVLYKPLDITKRETVSAREQSDTRQASVVESFVDFQRQMHFKMNVIQNIAAKSNEIEGKKYPKSEGRKPMTRAERDAENLRARAAQQKTARRGRKPDPFRTPVTKSNFNPLDDRLIIEKYALEVASEVREDSQKKRRHIAPIPFDITLLDDENDDDEAETH